MNYPGAWFVAGWATREVWRAATWPSTYDWVGTTSTPVYYDYGNTIVYQGDTVYTNGQEVASSEQYYEQASGLASSGQPAENEPEPQADDWLPLGVFAVTQEGQSQSNMTFQLAVNKEGIIRGNFENILADNVEPVQGSVDKQSQRIAWTIGDNKEIVVETGLSNLTMEQAPALVHFGADNTQQVLLVRLEEPSEGAEK